MAVHSFPVFTTPVLIKGGEVATLSGKPQQPVAACMVESAVRESSRSPGQHLLCFSLPPHQRNLQLIIMHGYEEIQDREDTTSMCDGTLCLLVFREVWASEDSPCHSLLNHHLVVGKKGEKKREGRCPSALLHTGETATAGLRRRGHSSEAGGLLCSVFVVTVLTLENTDCVTVVSVWWDRGVTRRRLLAVRHLKERSPSVTEPPLRLFSVFIFFLCILFLHIGDKA